MTILPLPSTSRIELIPVWRELLERPAPQLTPYVRHDQNEIPSQRNPVLELINFADGKAAPAKNAGCTSDMLPTGLSTAPVTCVNRGIRPKVHWVFKRASESQTIF